MTDDVNPVRALVEAWEADAIAKAYNDSQIKALGLCSVCMVKHPCICEKYATIEKMREYYEAHRRTWFRREPTATRSWGIPVDVLMEGLYEIATENWKRVKDKG